MSLARVVGKIVHAHEAEIGDHLIYNGFKGVLVEFEEDDHGYVNLTLKDSEGTESTISLRPEVAVGTW